MIIYDDTEPSEKLRVYDKGVNITNGSGNGRPGSGHHIVSDTTNGDRFRQMVSYRTGDMFVPHLDDTEALKTEVNELVRCLHDGDAPIGSGQASLRMVRVLEAAQRSLAAGGVPMVPYGATSPAQAGGRRPADRGRDGRPAIAVKIERPQAQQELGLRERSSA